MDGQRFDSLARAMASGATRRRTLRLAGGGLAGALLAAAGLGRRARAELNPACGDLEARCYEQGLEACGPMQHDDLYGPWADCLFREVPVCRSYFQNCSGVCAYMGGCGQVGCPEGQSCQALLNPGNRIVCRCRSL